MNDQNFTTTFTVDQTPEEAFAAINNVRGWWSGDPGIEGSTDKLGDEFTYRYKPHHYSKQKITELIPGKKVVWLVLDGYLNFIEDNTMKRSVESGWGGDAVVCADSVGSDRGGSGEPAQHDSVQRPGLISSCLLCRNRLSSPVTPIEAA